MLALKLLEEVGFASVALFARRLHLLSPKPDADRERIRQVLAAGGVALLAIEPKPLTLENVFVYRILALEKQEYAQGARA